MSLEIHLLASGSRGNCALVCGGEGSARTVLVLDCGIPQRTARAAAEACGHLLTRVDAVLLSHHHSDHSANVVPVAARARVPLYAHPEALEVKARTGAAERQRRRVEARALRAGESLRLGALRITPVRLPHDAEPTHGFLFEADGRRAGFFTDLGRPEVLTGGILEGLDGLVLEFNHDPDLLAAGPYPQELRRRVGGDRGHLSNEQAAWLLREAAPATLRSLVLAHLSEQNNSPELALEAARDALRRRGLTRVEPRVARRRGPVSLFGGAAGG